MCPTAPPTAPQSLRSAEALPHSGLLAGPAPPSLPPPPRAREQICGAGFGEPNGRQPCARGQSSRSQCSAVFRRCTVGRIRPRVPHDGEGSSNSARLLPACRWEHTPFWGAPQGSPIPMYVSCLSMTLPLFRTLFTRVWTWRAWTRLNAGVIRDCWSFACACVGYQHSTSRDILLTDRVTSSA